METLSISVYNVKLLSIYFCYLCMIYKPKPNNSILYIFVSIIFFKFTASYDLNFQCCLRVILILTYFFFLCKTSSSFYDFVVVVFSYKILINDLFSRLDFGKQKLAFFLVFFSSLQFPFL